MYNILMVAPTPFFADRGCHVRIYEEARILQQLGNRVTITTYHNGRDIPGIRTVRIPNVPWYNKLEAGPSWHKLYLDLMLLATSAKVMRQEKPDLIHAHLHEGAFIGRALQMIKRTPLLLDYQGGLTDEMVTHKFMEEHGMIYKFFHGLERFTQNSAEAIMISSPNAARAVRQHFPEVADKVHLIYDWIDTRIFQPGADVAELKQRYPIPDDRTVVAFCGILNHYQGLDCLMDAIPLALKRDPKLHFLIIGFPTEKYEALAREKGVANHVTFTGRIDYADVPRYLCLADVAVAPKMTKTEANGKVLQYMACGLPTVVFDLEINRAMLGDLGIYADYGNAESLAAKIAELTLDEERVAFLSGAVRERAIREFSIESIAQKILQVYALLTQERSNFAPAM